MMDVKIVGSDGERTLYVVLENEEIIPGSLFRLTHPGNRKVSAAQDEMLVMGGEKGRDKLSTEPMVDLFFDRCIVGLNASNAANESESMLVEKYGENKNVKPDFDKLPLSQMNFWKGLAIRFCKGDLFDSIPEIAIAGNGTVASQKPSKAGNK